MSKLEILLLAVALAADAFAVSLAAAAAGFADSGRATFRLAFHFGLFQFLMPILGWILGTSIEAWIRAVDHWIASGLLVVVAVNMMRGAFQQEETVNQVDPSRGFAMVMLAIATSIDALAVGISLAALRIGVVGPSVTIGCVTSLLCFFAIVAGRRIGQSIGRYVQVLGALILILIALRVLVTHLAGG